MKSFKFKIGDKVTYIHNGPLLNKEFFVVGYGQDTSGPEFTKGPAYRVGINDQNSYTLVSEDNLVVPFTEYFYESALKGISE